MYTVLNSIIRDIPFYGGGSPPDPTPHIYPGNTVPAGRVRGSVQCACSNCAPTKGDTTGHTQMRGSALTCECVRVGGALAATSPPMHDMLHALWLVLLRSGEGPAASSNPCCAYPGGPRVGSRTTHLFPSPPSSWAQPWDPGEGVIGVVHSRVVVCGDAVCGDTVCSQGCGFWRCGV